MIETNDNQKEKRAMPYIIFDLEATCWEEKNDKIKEIIEIGAVKLDENLEITDTFSQFVKPIINPELTDFCKSLTSINQENVGHTQFRVLE